MRMDERIVFEFFTNEQHLERLFKFLTLEDKSNHKSFANKYYLAYRVCYLIEYCKFISVVSISLMP